MTDVLSRYSNDVIANVAFGIKSDSMIDKTNEFYTKIQEVTNFKQSDFEYIVSLVTRVINFLYTFTLPFENTKQQAYNFFENIVNDAIDARKKEKSSRPDMINFITDYAPYVSGK